MKKNIDKEKELRVSTGATKKVYLVDAADKKLGRVASQIATYLTGKNTTGYVRNMYPNISVQVTNASKMAIDEKKSGSKTYKFFSGYPGGLREETLENLANRQGYAEILRKAVYGMVPSNRLRSRIMKNLTITE
ncbi:MAG: 50S ribosomal protein L13 [Minisyncoccia bacterium]